MRYPEWQALIITIAGGVAAGLLGGLAIICQRWFKNEPLWPKGREKITSPAIFYKGIVLFTGMSAVAFVARLPLFGTFILAMSASYVLGLIAFKRGWRG